MLGTHKQPMSPLHLSDLDSTSLHIGSRSSSLKSAQTSSILCLHASHFPSSLEVHFNPQRKLPHCSHLCMPRCYEHTLITELSPGATVLGTSPRISVGVKCRHQITGICTTPTPPLHIPAAKMDHSPGGAIQEYQLPTSF